jgi:hypothetical protein
MDAHPVEQLAGQQVVPEFRELVVHGALAELEGLLKEMQARSIREGGRVDLTLDDIEARIAQVRELLP